MKNKVGVYSLAASIATSMIVVILFYVFAIGKAGLSVQYSYTDIYGGMIYAFILSMIVSASIWPGIIEKRMKKQ